MLISQPIETTRQNLGIETKGVLYIDGCTYVCMWRALITSALRDVDDDVAGASLWILLFFLSLFGRTMTISRGPNKPTIQSDFQLWDKRTSSFAAGSRNNKNNQNKAYKQTRFSFFFYPHPPVHPELYKISTKKYEPKLTFFSSSSRIKTYKKYWNRRHGIGSKN